MKITLIYNAKGFQIDKYNIILLRKLGNITYYFSSFFSIYGIFIRVTPPVLLIFFTYAYTFIAS